MQLGALRGLPNPAAHSFQILQVRLAEATDCGQNAAGRLAVREGDTHHRSDAEAIGKATQFIAIFVGWTVQLDSASVIDAASQESRCTACNTRTRHWCSRTALTRNASRTDSRHRPWWHAPERASRCATDQLSAMPAKLHLDFRVLIVPLTLVAWWAVGYLDDRA